MVPKFERVGFIEKIVKKALMPLLSVRAIGNFFFVKLSNVGQKIKAAAATYRALEMIYTYSWKSTQGEKFWDRLFTHILLNFTNAKAVRNRLLFVKQEIKEAISSFEKDEVHIMSLGSGSARAIIEALSEAPNSDKRYTATLVDRNSDALAYSQRLAEEKGVLEKIAVEKGLLEEFVRNGHNHPPDIIEMVGIMDYLSEATVVKIIRETRRLLSPGGIFITCNISDNSERTFLERVLGWKMIYRRPEDLCRILTKAGFEQPKIITEPLGIHIIAIGKK